MATVQANKETIELTNEEFDLLKKMDIPDLDKPVSDCGKIDIIFLKQMVQKHCNESNAFKLLCEQQKNIRDDYLRLEKEIKAKNAIIEQLQAEIDTLKQNNNMVDLGF